MHTEDRLHGIYWCDQGFFQLYHGSVYRAMQILRDKYLSALCTGEWWPVDLLPLEVSQHLHKENVIPLAGLFCAIYFENHLVAILLR